MHYKMLKYIIKKESTDHTGDNSNTALIKAVRLTKERKNSFFSQRYMKKMARTDRYYLRQKRENIESIQENQKNIKLERNQGGENQKT